MSASPSPLPPRRRTDTEMAASFRDLESSLCTTRDAFIAAEFVFEECIEPGAFAQDIKNRFGGMKGYEVLVMTEDQFTALHYVMRRARDEADLLRKVYYAGFGGADL